MTPAQRKVLDAIQDYVTVHGRPPTLAEIAEDLGCSRITVWEHAQRLKETGHLQKSEGRKYRSLVPTGSRCSLCGQPILVERPAPTEPTEA